jgi:hypothetical protein
MIMLTEQDIADARRLLVTVEPDTAMRLYGSTTIAERNWLGVPLRQLPEATLRKVNVEIMRLRRLAKSRAAVGRRTAAAIEASKR